ncbi:MAG: glycosyltransferase family 39 protein [Anaerolineae bacterium]|nr:glycosyltransferase family 39 protein [Anaerolineae bacterium]
MQQRTITLFGLILAGFALRIYYLTTTHPFFDEYTTVLAARQIIETGWPVLPSGLFYEHGLLATYVIAPFTALFSHQPLASWQPAHWGLMLSRWPSVLISTLTIPFIYFVGQKTDMANPLAKNAALLAAGLFAFSPEGMVWGGRARMYALATLLVLVTVYLAYRGTIYPYRAAFRWGALLALLAALLTQLGALMLIPPLIIAMLVNSFSHNRPRQTTTRLWFLQKTVLLEGLALAAIVALAVFVKRLGRPIGFDSLATGESHSLLPELINTIRYQTAVSFTLDETIKFLSRQFGVPHHLWLTLATITGAGLGLILLAIITYHRSTIPASSLQSARRSANQNPVSNPPISQSPNPAASLRTGLHSPFSILYSPFFTPLNLFLWLTFGLIILEMVTLLDPFRRNPRYLVMMLPLFYLIAAYALFNGVIIVQQTIAHAQRPAFAFYSAIALLILFTSLNLGDLRLALITPEPAYEDAFAKIYADWQPGDTLLTMNTPAAGLYLGQVDGFTIQNDAQQFLLNADTQPVDRWLGAPWIGSAAAFNTALNNSPRTWFVTDTIRQPVYFRGDWQAILSTQMEQVWAGDNALLYRTRPDRTPLPTQPDTMVNANFDHTITLTGYALTAPPAADTPSQLNLVLFWQPLNTIATDYTTFLHLRTAKGDTVAQRDSQPLAGAYPTSQWQPGETIIDPLTLPLPNDLPAGTYQLYTGLYRLDTLARLPVTDDVSGENAISLGEIRLP